VLPNAGASALSERPDPLEDEAWVTEAPNVDVNGTTAGANWSEVAADSDNDDWLVELATDAGTEDTWTAGVAGDCCAAAPVDASID